MIKATFDVYDDNNEFSKKTKSSSKQISDKKEIHCIECNRLLAEMLIIGEDVKLEEMKYQLVCPCGGESFTIATYLLVRFLFAEGLTPYDIKTNKGKITQYLKEFNG